MIAPALPENSHSAHDRISGQAAQMEEWAEKKGARYLDGAIIAYPSGIGTPGSMLIMAGDEAAWVASEALIRVLGPASRYVGSDVAVPAALDFAIIFQCCVTASVIQDFICWKIETSALTPMRIS